MEISTGYVVTPIGRLPRKADLAPKSNILINSNGRACLAGFSLLTLIPDELIATSLDSPNDTTQRVSGVQWSAPEVLKGGRPGKETDVFSLAMVMVEVRSGGYHAPTFAYRNLLIQVFSKTAPLGDVQDTMAIFLIIEGKRPPRPKNPHLTGGLWKIIQRCWDECPSSRPGASEVLKALVNSSVSHSHNCAPTGLTALLYIVTPLPGNS